MNSEDDHTIDALREEVEALRHDVRELRARVTKLESGSEAEKAATPARPVSESEARTPAPTLQPPKPAFTFPKPPAQKPPTLATAATKTQAPAPEPKPVVPPKPSLLDLALAKARKALGPAPGQSMEVYLTTRLLPIVAVLVIGTGVVFLAVLAMQVFRNAPWMPYARLAVGYAIAAGLLLGGVRTRDRNASYAGLLFGSGMALTYFMTFATHFLPFARIFERPEPTLLLLGVVVVAWGAVAHFRDNRRMALAMTVLGHFTVGVSTAYINPPSAAGVLGIVALSLGSAWFMATRGWFRVGIAGLILAYANHFYYLANSPSSTTLSSFLMALLVIVVYYVIFAAAEFLRHAKEADPTLAFRWRTLYVALNTVAFLFIGTGTMEAFAFSRPHLHLLYFITAAVLVGAGVAHRQRDRNDILYNTYFTKASVVGTIGLALYFEGATLTLSIALEATALLVSARLSKLPVTRVLGYAAGVLAFALTTLLLVNPDLFDIDAPTRGMVVVPVALTVLIYYVAATLYMRTDWRPSQLPKDAIWPSLLGFARELDLIRSEEEGTTRQGEILATLFAAAGAILSVLGGWQCLPAQYAQIILAGLALAGTSAALMLRARPLATVSLLPAITAPVFLVRYAGPEGLPGPGSPEFWPSLLLSGGALLGLLALCELHFRHRDRKDAWILPVAEDGAGIFHWVYGMVAAVMGGLVVLLYSDSGSWSFWSAVLASVLAAWSVGLNSRAMRLPILGLTLACGFLGLIEYGDYDATLTLHLATLAALLAVAVTTEPRFTGARNWAGAWRERGAPYVAYLVPALLYGTYGAYAFTPEQAMPYLGIGMIATALTFPVLHARAVGWSGVYLLVLATALWPDRDTYTLVLLAAPPLLVAAAFGADFLLRRFQVFAWPVANTIALAAGLFLALRYPRMLAGPDAFYPWWGIVAAIFLGYAAWGRSLPAAVLGVAFTLFSTAILVASSFERDLSTFILVFGYAVHIAVFLGIERGYAYGGHPLPKRLGQENQVFARGFLAGAPVALTVLMLAAIPTLSSYYLTISWSLAAIAAFGVAAVTREAYYRYAALCVLGLAVLRVTFVDVRELEGLYRIAAWIFLGIVLLVVSYVYTVSRAKAVQKESAPSTGEDADQNGN